MKTFFFACHGNICRLTMAGFVMMDMVVKAGLDAEIFGVSKADYIVEM